MFQLRSLRGWRSRRRRRRLPARWRCRRAPCMRLSSYRRTCKRSVRRRGHARIYQRWSRGLSPPIALEVQRANVERPRIADSDEVVREVIPIRVQANCANAAAGHRRISRLHYVIRRGDRCTVLSAETLISVRDVIARDVRYAARDADRCALKRIGGRGSSIG